MKKTAIIIAAVVLALVIIVGCVPNSSSANTEFLRIHIRADSNSADDQQVKYAVKQAVVDYLTPFLSTAHSKSAAMSVVNSQLSALKSVCDQTLKAQGKTYCATVKLCRENFPDRTYNGVTLAAGVYDALIIQLGSGSGNNWWCVVYPPLCFVGESNGTKNIVYKSKLMEIIQQWLQSHK